LPLENKAKRATETSTCMELEVLWVLKKRECGAIYLAMVAKPLIGFFGVFSMC